MSALNKGPDSSLVGQEDDEAKVAVRQQRDMKRKIDRLRKLEKKMRSVKEGTGEHAATVEEYKTLKEEIEAATPTPTTTGGGGGKTPPAGGVAAGGKGTTSSHGQRSGNVKAPVRGKTNAATRSPPKTSPTSSSSSPAGKQVPEDANLEENSKRGGKSAPFLKEVSAFPRGPCQPPCSSKLVHHHVAELALMMKHMMVVGGNARTFAMINSFKYLLKHTHVLSCPSLRDVKANEFKELIDENFSFLCHGRAASTGMKYVRDLLIRRFEAIVSSGGLKVAADGVFGPVEYEGQQAAYPESSAFSLSIGTELGNCLSADPREVALKVLVGIEKELSLSIKSIVEDRSVPLLSSNDTILVFGRSSTVELILLAAANNTQLTIKPKVIVVDSAPLYEGKALAKRLTASGLSVTYGLITSCCTLLPHCTRVFIGASAVLQNGDVFSRCGTAVVVASAKQYRKPVLCFSESFKFVPEVWLGNLGQNTQLNCTQSPPVDHRNHSSSGINPATHQSHEVSGLPPNRGDEQFSVHPGVGSASGYLYDLTPAAFIDMIVCEMGCLHTSAIVAALRDREDRDACLMSAA